MRRFHVCFSPAQIGRILHRLDWTVQAPQRRAASATRTP
ncbi:winged helix-turn-helix domain-containing protein [Streptomyces rimosus]